MTHRSLAAGMAGIFGAGLFAASAPASAQAVMGPHLDASEYVRARGGDFGAAVSIRFETARIAPPSGYDARLSAEPVDAPELPAPDAIEADGDTIERVVMVGADWALGERGDARTLYDFAARRVVAQRRDQGVFVNGSVYAAAQRSVDILAVLSEGGQAPVISFDGVGDLDRFWLEAAMGAASEPADLDRREDEGRKVWLRGEHEIAAITRDGCDAEALTPEQMTSFAGWMNTALALHPDIIDDIAAHGAPPCALTFAVYSPESPEGRIESWRITDISTDPAPRPLALDLRPQLPGYGLLGERAAERIIGAARGVGDDPLSPADFMELIEAAQDEDDHAGAWLLIASEGANFGPCPSETVGSARLVCAGLPAILRAAEGDEGYEQIMQAVLAAGEGAHRAATEALLPHIEREDRAGAAARMMLANQMIGWGPEGLETYQAIDPGALLEQALALDPHAPDFYWHLGLRYLEAGAPEAAFALFDLGRALPDRETTPLLSQADALQARLAELAPGHFPFGGPETSEDAAD